MKTKLAIEVSYEGGDFLGTWAILEGPPEVNKGNIPGLGAVIEVEIEQKTRDVIVHDTLEPKPYGDGYEVKLLGKISAFQFVKIEPIERNENTQYKLSTNAQSPNLHTKTGTNPADVCPNPESAVDCYSLKESLRTYLVEQLRLGNTVRFSLQDAFRNI